jgi:hypothetical protein
MGVVQLHVARERMTCAARVMGREAMARSPRAGSVRSRPLGAPSTVTASRPPPTLRRARAQSDSVDYFVARSSSY